MNEENIDYSRMSTEEKVRHFENAIVQSLHGNSEKDR